MDRVNEDSDTEEGKTTGTTCRKGCSCPRDRNNPALCIQFEYLFSCLIYRLIEKGEAWHPVWDTMGYEGRKCLNQS